MEINNVNIIHEEMRIEKSFRRIDDDISYRKKETVSFERYLFRYLFENVFNH